MMVFQGAAGGCVRAALPVAISVSLLAVLPADIHADESQVNPLPSINVVSASGFEQKITEAPASISVISEEQLRSRPFTSVVDAVRDLEGVDVGETRDKTGQASVSMRGMGADYTLILIDGRRQNNHGDIYPNDFGGNQFNHIPPIDAIARIEVIRGPASTLYGADAMGGVINIITKKNFDQSVASITVGGTFQEDSRFGNDVTTDLYVSGPLVPGKLGLALRGSIYDRQASEPEFKPVADPNGVVHTRQLGFGGGGRTVRNRDLAGGFTLRWTPLESQRLSLDYDNSVQKYDNGKSQLGTQDSVDRLPRAGYTKDQEFTREQLALTHEGEWDFGFSTVSVTHLATNNTGRTLPLTAAERDQYDQMVSDGATDQELEAAFLPRPKRKLESRELRLDGKLELPVNDQHFAVLGTQVIRGELEDGVFGLEQGRSGRVSEHNMWALFAEDNWTPVVPFTLTAGVRYDNHDTFGEQFSPRLYGVYALTPAWTVKGGVSTGYKTPKTTDLFEGITGFGAQGTRPWVGNPDLKPETSVNSEIALYWESAQRHNFNVTYFQNDFKDKIVRQESVLCADSGGQKPCVDLGAYDSLGGVVTQPVNVDKAEIKGVEVAGRYQFLPAWALRGNYTYTDSEQKSGANKGDPLNNTARHMLNTTLDWQTTQHLGLYLTMEARRDRFRGSSNPEAPKYWKNYEIFHLGARWAMNETFTFTARVNNLLDEDFTSYDTVFEDDGMGGFTPIYFDHYNNKDARRSFWLSANARF